ncbi:MAG: (2Fe-2S) ferredoxin domain-containing protein, partial [Thermoplasmata archaeon]|nr:(2Fe-2S) ferredoxin domain-containing protein [Thermoplasmata archaeon]
MMDKVTSSRALDELRESLQTPSDKPLVIIGSGTCGEAQGSKAVVEVLQETITAKGMQVEVRITGCLGFCEIEPIVVVR